MRTLLILRTHRADPETLAAFDRYAALRSADVVICCDEINGAVDPGGRVKLGFNSQVLIKLGLFQHPTCGWRCGDYSYYVTRAAMPNYDFYWLIEPDVVLNTADLNATFDALNAASADFLAARFGPRDERWGWNRMMRHCYAAVYGCIFPITRLSARAIDHLHAARRNTPVPDTPAAVDGWPNDEVFVATELQNHGFECRELGYVHPELYTRNSLRTGVPWDRDTLAAQIPDGRIYHPVRRFSTWFEEQSKWAADYSVSGRGRGHAHFRPDVRKLIRLASSVTEHKELYGAALFPLMLASRMTLEATYVDEAGRLGSYREISASPDRAIATLAGRFHPRDSRRTFATACLLEGIEDMRSRQVAAASDFSWHDIEPLQFPPVTFSLPYACDFDQNTLLLTVHPLPSTVLSADSVLDEQRRQARVGCWVDFRHLHRFYPLPAKLPAISFLLIGDAESRGEATHQLRRAGTRPVTNPPALMQLARHSDQFFKLRRRWRDALLWAAIAPAFVTYGTTLDAMVFVVSDEMLPLRGTLQALLVAPQFFFGVDECDMQAHGVG